jgi:transcriptional regulator with XRE-family HTH domain
MEKNGHMRRSSLRHPVAALRAIIGLAQPEFAKLVGIAESTLAKIESLRLPLSKENAIRISDAVGVSMGWLLQSDPGAPPAADSLRFGEQERGPIPFTREVFDECRAQIEVGQSPNIHCQVPPFQFEAIAAAASKGKRARMFNYKIKKAIEALREEFGQDERALARQEAKRWKLAEFEIELMQPATRQFLREALNKRTEPHEFFCRLVDYGAALGSTPYHEIKTDYEQIHHIEQELAKDDIGTGQQKKQPVSSRGTRAKKTRAKNPQPSAKPRRPRAYKPRSSARSRARSTP